MLESIGEKLGELGTGSEKGAVGLLAIVLLLVILAFMYHYFTMGGEGFSASLFRRDEGDNPQYN